MILSEFISPDMNVARSVNLERDLGSKTALRHYHLTRKGLEILSRLVAALTGERVSEWSLTGPYGMGKSSFANFLLTLCGPGDEEETRIAWQMLKRRDLHLARQLHHLFGKHSARATGLFRVGVTSSFESINRTLAKGIRRSLLDAKRRWDGHQGFSELISKAESLSQQVIPETTELVKLLQKIRKVHGTPIAIVVDEFGKNLEYLARFPAQGDLFVLQMLAESEGIFLWVCLHQAFEEYTSRLSARQMQEWGKIQGRFEDISFIETKTEMIRSISETLVRKDKNPQLIKAVRQWAEAFYREARRLNLPELKGMGAKTIERFFPLHPLAALVLPELCTRFAQNDRTLFAFLCSGEPTALPAFLASETIDPASSKLATCGPERLYDYFVSSNGGILLSRPESHRWIEIHDIIERSRNVHPFHLSVLKVVGLLNLISGPSGFRASKKLLSFAFLRPCANSNHPPGDLFRVLQDNMESGVLVYREYADEFRLWEGTDFDIPKAVRERRALLATQSLEGLLKKIFPLTPLTASRHSYVTGTLRHFERRWCDVSQITEEAAFRCSNEMDGVLLYCFGREQSPPAVPSKTDDGRPIILCYVPCEDQIREAILDLAAAAAVLKQSPELTHDGVARKEVRFRAQAAEERLRAFLNMIFAPGNEEAQWFVMGKRRQNGVASHRDLSRLLSECCDTVYSDCPWIRNELINRNSLSAAAARARKVLIDAMVLHENKEMLGFRGTGPEVAIYRTMLLQENLHREGGDGRWAFAPPGPESKYFKLWECVTSYLERAGRATIPVTEVIDMLKKPPFGLKKGPIPVLLCLYLLVHANEVALYQEGSFVHVLQPEEMELMTKRPEFFSLRLFQEQTLRGKVVKLYSSLVQAQLIDNLERLRNTSLISIVGPLVQFVKNLKPYALHTKNLSTNAQNVRQAILFARDPYDLLYIDLPRALGKAPFAEDTDAHGDLADFREQFSNAIIELKQAYPKLIENIKHVVSESFDRTSSAANLRSRLKERAYPVVDWCSDAELKPLVKAMAGFSGTDEDWLVSVATIVSQRPVDSWRDSDLQDFATRMRDMAHRFLSLETLVARTEKVFLKPVEGRTPRMVALTKPDGSTASRIIWHNEALVGDAQQTVENLVQAYGNDRSALETIFVMLGDRILSEQSGASEDTGNE